MSDKTYQIVVSGELIEGAYLPDVKVKLAALFNAPVERLDPLFSGKRAVIKKGLDEAAAQKYCAAVMAAGLCCVAEVLPMAAAPAAISIAPPGALLVEAPKVATPIIDISAYSVAPRGVTLDETPRPSPPEIDIGGLSAAPVGEDLVAAERPAVPQIDTGDLSMAPPGVLLAEDQPVAPPAIDISNLDLAPVGSDMGEMDRGKGLPPPDISHLKLD